jgi:N-succinyldiaminopimelate aminotransferase
LAEEFGVELEAVVVTSGATEALYVLLQSLVGPGEEVVVLEPFFDVYLPDAFLAGAEARLVRLDLGEGGVPPGPRGLGEGQSPPGPAFSS